MNFNRIIKNKKGNAIMLAILVLIVLGALGIGQLTSMITGARQSSVLFKGIDANFLLEGIVQEAESRIRGEANDYAKESDWFGIFRNTNIGSSSAWKSINLSGSQISDLAKEVDAEIKVKARFFSQDYHRRNGKKDGEKVNFGKEKLGQLEIIAQSKIGDNYYHAHAAKDVKVINPLTLSYNGQYNAINDYSMFIKYAMSEFGAQYPMKDKNGEFIKEVKFGNYNYNRLSDEKENPFYFVRFNNGDKKNKGKVYLGSPRNMRGENYKIVIDLPRESYGGFYKTELGKDVYNLSEPGYISLTFGSGKKKVTKKFDYVSNPKDYYIIETLLGKTILDFSYRQMYDGGLSDANKEPSLGSEAGRRIAAGGWLKKAMPVQVFKSVDGWEYALKPWDEDIKSPGFGGRKFVDGEEKSFLVRSPADWEDFSYKGLTALTWDGINITKYVESQIYAQEEEIKKSMDGSGSQTEESLNIVSPFIVAPTYPLYFMNSQKIYYNSYSHSSFIDNNDLNSRNEDVDWNNSGYRGHPVLQLNGAWKNNKWMSKTQVEGNVYARYMEGYYLRWKKDKTPVDPSNPPPEPTKEEKFKAFVETSVEGPNIRAKYGNYNSVAQLVPYNGNIIKPGQVMSYYDNGISDPDFANLYLDKVTAIYVDYRDFSHHNVKIEGKTMHIYLNGVYLINSAFPMPISDGIENMVYHGKGVILVAGDIQIKRNLLKKTDDDLLILASIGKNYNENLVKSFIRIDGETDKQYIRVEASLYAMNRDYYSNGSNAGIKQPCFISFAFGTQVYGNWAADFMYYYPAGTELSDKTFIANNGLRGTLLEYDTRLKDKNKGNNKNYLADISQPYAFWMVWKNKQSEI
ncbi:MAG: hypothetical protein M0R46_04700 [Candidatus Muirbacterium halophilum]|nr:hypothetical protein [Candidatus Muirbacterium halophilum]MCK9475195.1 hypothetical protein [Candidatus Muirbacterium halophilum]